MKLHHAHASPFARKCLAVAIARGLDARIELVGTNPHVSPPDLLKDNPLSKIPALVTDDGIAIYDSPVICEYLNTLGEAATLIPTSGTRSWIRVQVMQALADGMMDAAVARRLRFGKPVDDTRAAFLARQKAVVERGLAVLDAAPPEGLSDIGAIAVGCALGYLDFRFADEPWRAAHPKLAAWFEAASTLPPLARTVPA